MSLDITELETLDFHEKVLLAAVLAELTPSKASYDLEALRSSEITPSRHLTNNLINALIEWGHMTVEQQDRPKFKLVVENNDAALKKLLDDITQADLVSDETIHWIKSTLIAECINQMALFAERKGVCLCTAIKPPIILEELIMDRSMNEINMLSWQAVANINQRDLRLLGLSPDDKAMNSLFSEVVAYHKNYLRSHKKIAGFRNSGKRNCSSLSKVISHYIFGTSTRQFEERCFSALLDGL